MMESAGGAPARSAAMAREASAAVSAYTRKHDRTEPGMFGEKHRDEELEAEAREQAARAVEASESDDASVDSDEAVEEALEPDR